MSNYEAKAMDLLTALADENMCSDKRLDYDPGCLPVAVEALQSAADEKLEGVLAILEELRPLHEAATPAPWRSGRSDMLSYSGAGDGPYKNVYADDPEPEMHRGQPLPLTVARGETELCVENAELIAALRNALPRLLKALGRKE